MHVDSGTIIALATLMVAVLGSLIGVVYKFGKLTQSFENVVAHISDHSDRLTVVERKVARLEGVTDGTGRHRIIPPSDPPNERD